LTELTPALLGQLFETAPEVYRIIGHLGKLRCQVTH
jgi:hypothetical protein